MRTDARSRKFICLERLDVTALPPKEAFFSRLKKEGISDEDYASCQEAWRENVARFSRLVQRSGYGSLSAGHSPFGFYQQRGIDRFKQGISVPGLTLLYLFNDLPEKTYFTLFNEKIKDFLQLVKDHVIGGPSLIFNRYHEKGAIKLRQNERYVSVPDAFRAHFAEMQPVFKNIRLTRDDICPRCSVHGPTRGGRSHNVIKKLLMSSGYGKTTTTVDRHRDMKYYTEAVASLMVRRFRHLDIVVDDAYEIEMNKKTVKYATPICACCSSIKTLSTCTWSALFLWLKQTNGSRPCSVKKVLTGSSPCCILYRTCSLKTKRVVKLV